ncbi:MAG: cyclic nucleotide-binding domain-containing protein [Candidatus Omnitrophica bacterium]|nr:cyclic nucleotide-binding domain-containing protein [Candidatus Omnitrophota bacterium]
MHKKKILFPVTDIENVIAILNRIALFGGLSEKQLYAVFKVLKKLIYEKDEIIFCQGESPDYIYIVKSGKVKIYVEQETTSLELIEFDVGDCFGESSLIGIEPHTANAIAIEKSELLVLSGQAMLSLYKEEKDAYLMIVLNIAREVSRRLNKADDVYLHYVLGNRKK